MTYRYLVEIDNLETLKKLETFFNDNDMSAVAMPEVIAEQLTSMQMNTVFDKMRAGIIEPDISLDEFVKQAKNSYRKNYV